MGFGVKTCGTVGCANEEGGLIRRVWRNCAAPFHLKDLGGYC